MNHKIRGDETSVGGLELTPEPVQARRAERVVKADLWTEGDAGQRPDFSTGGVPHFAVTVLDGVQALAATITCPAADR